MIKPHWYIIYTKPKCELKVAGILTRKNIKNYCPLHTVENQLSESKKFLQQPLFASFVFVCIMQSELALVQKMPGVINFLYRLKNPAIIEQDEINMILKLSNEYNNLALEKLVINDDNTKVNAWDKAASPIISFSDPEIKIALPSLGYYIIATPS